jgi:uncharacterized protein YrrD
MSDLDLGQPTSYMTAAEGVPVLASDGEQVGKLEHVLSDVEADVFDGIVIAEGRLGGGHRFADASEVEAFYERAVVLKLDSEQAERLPEPSENPAVMGASPDDTAESELTRKLRAAWDRLSGNY